MARPGRLVGTACFAAVAVAAVACEDIAHVSDFHLDPSVSYRGACNACPVDAGAGLRHPPCPPSSDGEAPDDGHVYVYAWRRLRLGYSDVAGHETDPAYYDDNVGFDEDCSERTPKGLPVECAAQSPETALVPWAPGPHGIDNALMQRVFGYLQKLGTMNHLQPIDQEISGHFEVGDASVLDIVYNWNGTPNDSKVSFRVSSTLGTVGGVKPQWNGTDEWIAADQQCDEKLDPHCDPSREEFQIPDETFATDDAYVANGMLVADMGFLRPFNAEIVNNGASLEVSIYDFLFTGRITNDEIAYGITTGEWSVADIQQTGSDFANFLSGCNPLVTDFLCGLLPKLVTQAADMSLDPTPSSRSKPCDALSIGYGADAYRARIGRYVPVSAAAGCPLQCPASH